MLTITPHQTVGNFDATLYEFIKAREGSVPRIYSDSKGIPTLGVGYALIIEDNGVFRQRDNRDQELLSIGVTLSDNDKALLGQVLNALNSGHTLTAKQLVPEFKGKETAAKNKFSFSALRPGEWVKTA